MRRPPLSIAALLSAVAWSSFVVAEEPKLQVTHTAGKMSRVAVKGWDSSQLSALGKLQKENKLPAEVLQVYVTGDETTGDAASVPLFGKLAYENDTLLFRPRFPFLEGVAYRAVVRPAVLVGNDEKSKPVDYKFAIAAPDRKPSTSLVDVYPTGDVLPENQLKFYLHFSAPMSRGGIYRHLHLMRDDGSEVELPFLELGEELWDSSGQRLTVLFDPGRIKRGLKPREEEGPVLEEGKAYTFVVDSKWQDAKGQPLVRSFRKQFKSAAPDDVQPDVKRWKIDAPSASAKQPLTVTFAEPLDHAMLQRVFSVRGPDGEFLAGEVEVDRGEMRWRFTPAKTWQAGGHALVVATTLEDRAGNSLGRPFEVDIFNRVDRGIETPTVAISFRVTSAE